MLRTPTVAVGLTLGAALGALAGDGPSPPRTRDVTANDRAIRLQSVIEAPRHVVWKAWSSSAGIKQALGVESKVVLDLGGAYEWYFLPDTAAHKGARGGEGNTILSYLPEQMISFTWNAPPKFPKLRSRRTWVVVRLEPDGNTRTRVSLTHLGWGTGGNWDAVHEYFRRAWPSVLKAHAHNLKGRTR